MNNFFYKVNDKEYEVCVTQKSMKSVRFVFRDNKFIVTCPKFYPKYGIIKGLDKYAEKLIAKGKKEQPLGEDYIYIFGEKIIINNSGKLHIEGYPEFAYKSHEDLLKKIKPIFLTIITNRCRYYEKLMNLPSYRITIRKMTSRYGSNSKTSKHITFATILLHYSLPIIDSVVVHELAHIEVFDHSKKFYDVVYKYCPDYDVLHKKLRKGEYK